MRFRLHTCLLFLVATTALFSQKPAKINSLLWEISGPGLARPSYLYGTMHVPAKMVYNLSDSFYLALRQADCIGLETNPSDWQAFYNQLNGSGQAQNPVETEVRSYGNSNYGPGFSLPLANNSALSSLLSSKPAMVNQLLFRTAEYRQDFEEDTYLDLFIYQAACKLGKPVIALEGIESSFLNAQRSTIPDLKKKKKEGDEEEDRPDRPTNLMEKLREAYRAQDIELLDSLNHLANSGENRQKFMLDVRNEEMVIRFDSLMKTGQSVFAGVGAAHLPGKLGMLEMFRQRGLSVRPVQFKSPAELREKQSIDDLKVPVIFEKRWSPDSAWTAESPRPFFTAGGGRGIEQSLAADMANGSFYAVFRLPTNGAMNGQSVDLMENRLDSLLYEGIPGKIIDRKRFKNAADSIGSFGSILASEPVILNKNRGHEISTRTRRGDVQRYKFVITPAEIFLFFVGGTADYALGEEADRFLKSARVVQKSSSDWSVFQPKTGGFRVEMPVSRFENWQPGLFQPSVNAWSEADSTAYYFSRRSLFDYGFIEEDTFELNWFHEKFMADFDGKVVSETLELADAAHPAKSFSFHPKDDSTAFIHGKIVIDGPFYYLLASRSNSAAPPARFFQSFDFQPVRYPNGFSEMVDSTTQFRFQLPQNPAFKKLVLIDKLVAIRKEAAEVSRKNENEQWQPDGRATTSLLRFQPSGEEMILSFQEKHSGMNLFPTEDSLRRFEENGLSNNGEFLFKTKNWKRDGDWLRGDFTVADTNSTREKWVKIWLHGHRTWQAEAVVNGAAPPSDFLKNAWNSLAPFDTSSVFRSMIGKADPVFLEGIYATDSLVRLKNRQQMRTSRWKKYEVEDFPRVVRAIETPGFDSLSMNDRLTLLDIAQRTKSPEMLPFLNHFWKKWPDSLTYQLHVLNILADMNTRESSTRLGELLHDEWLYLPEDNRRSIFSSLYDSLELAAPFFPDFFELMAHSEYENEVEDLLVALVDSGLVKPKILKGHKADWLREANFELSKKEFAAFQEAVKKRGKSDDRNDYDDDNYYGRVDPSAGKMSRLCHLLLPFYRSDKKVRQFFTDLLKISEPEEKLTLFDLFFGHGIEVSQAELFHLADDEKTMAHTFYLLKKWKKEAGFESCFQDSMQLVRSYFQGLYPMTNWDTLQFVSRHRFVEQGRAGQIYFFEIKPKKEKKRDLAWLVLPDGWDFRRSFGNGSVDYGNTIFNHEIVRQYGEKRKTTAELISEKLAAGRNFGRQRVPSKNRYGDDE